MSDPTPMSENPLSLNLTAALEATEGISTQCFTVYVPNNDKNDVEIGTQRLWVLEVIRLLSEINGGATAIPVEGGWINEEGKTILEHPVVVYSYITDPLRFGSSLHRLRSFLHRMGKETNQGEVAFEFDGEFYRIRQFDQPTAGAHHDG
jgi:hypothetical protein